MENRARYVLIGAFVLACVLAGFGFVYWIVNIGGIGARSVYAVRFEEPVAGVTPGASVLFNGVRVGTVTAVKLDPQVPKQVTLLLSVAPDTPVRADTAATLSFQGFTGAPALALTGGSPDAPPLQADNGHPPVLLAARGAGESLTDAARATLKRVDEVVDQNDKPLTAAIAGIAAFADMLGRNSKRVEGMLGGLEALTGGGKKEVPAIYDLTAATDFAGIVQTIQSQIAVGDVNALLVFDSQKIQVRTADGIYTALPDVQWADTLPKLVQAKLVQSFENAHQLAAVSRPLDQLTPEYRLELSIRSFATGPDRKAEVAFAVRLVGEKGVKAAQAFVAGADAANDTPAGIVAALDRAFRQAASEIVHWTIAETASPEPPPDTDKPL